MGQSYKIPEANVLSAAVKDAVSREDEDPFTARVMCLVLAAAVRDILTQNDPSAPFDAVGLGLSENKYGTVTMAGGTYWTSTGEARIDDEFDQEALQEWADYLTEANRAGWQPLCTVVERADERTIYRLDLVAAATAL